MWLLKSAWIKGEGFFKTFCSVWSIGRIYFHLNSAERDKIVYFIAEMVKEKKKTYFMNLKQ